MISWFLAAYAISRSKSIKQVFRKLSVFFLLIVIAGNAVELIRMFESIQNK